MTWNKKKRQPRYGVTVFCACHKSCFPVFEKEFIQKFRLRSLGSSVTTSWMSTDCEPNGQTLQDQKQPVRNFPPKKQWCVWQVNNVQTLNIIKMSNSSIFLCNGCKVSIYFCFSQNPVREWKQVNMHLYMCTHTNINNLLDIKIF